MTVSSIDRHVRERGFQIATPLDAVKRTKVVFVIDNMRYGGTELNAIRTAEQLDLEQFDLRVICLSEDGPLTERYRARGIPVENLHLRSLYGASMLTAGWRFAREMSRQRVDVVHAHDVYSNIFATIWARVARVPVVIASRRWWHSLPNAKLRLGNRIAFRLADAVLANSNQVARTVHKEGIPSDKVWTIPNFADDAGFDFIGQEERSRLRRNWGVPEGHIIIGCVARFDAVKDHATLLRGFAALHERGLPVFLVLIGDGPTRPAIETLIGELGIGNHVYLAGEVRAGGNLHYGIDISVLTSISEGFPNSLVEAMAAGNPVIATNVGGTADAVVDGETGLLVPPGDPEVLAEALSCLVGDSERRRALGRAGKERALRTFRASAVLSQLQAMYHQLAAQASSGKRRGVVAQDRS